METIEWRNIQSKKERNIAVKIIDTALKLEGDLKQYGNLSKGLKDLLNSFKVTGIDQEDRYLVEVVSLSLSGHDFLLVIDKNTGTITDWVVGNLVPEPIDLD